MLKWEYMVLKVAYTEANKNKVKCAALDNHNVLSNVLKAELDAYLETLETKGWCVVNTYRYDKTQETYNFKRPLQ